MSELKAIRDKVRGVCETRFTSQQASNAEKKIYNMAIKKAKENGIKSLNSDFVDVYTEISYEALAIQSDNYVTFDPTKIQWDTCVYDNLKVLRNIEEGKMDMDNIPDGIHKCVFCGSFKSFSIAIQDRRGDEGASEYVMCANCGKKNRTRG